MGGQRRWSLKENRSALGEVEFMGDHGTKPGNIDNRNMCVLILSQGTLYVYERNLKSGPFGSVFTNKNRHLIFLVSFKPRNKII